MTKFYVEWWLDPARMPVDAEERVRGWLQILEMVKADMASGKIRDWGCAPEGDFGHAIIEAENGTEVLASLLKYRPYVNFKVALALTVDQVIETVKKMAAQK